MFCSGFKLSLTVMSVFCRSLLTVMTGFLPAEQVLSKFLSQAASFLWLANPA